MAAPPSIQLALDCSTARGSVALGDGNGVVVWRTEFEAGRGHGGKLFAALAEAMRVGKEAAAGPLCRIVVGLGPGSYSGVRQAIAVATGLSVATGARLVGLPSPLALETDAPAYQAVGDARRGTFYYTAVADRVCIVGPELLENRATLEQRLAQRSDWPVLTVECATIPDLAANLTASLPLAERLLVIPEPMREPFPLEPLYLRPPAITLPKGEAVAD